MTTAVFRTDAGAGSIIMDVKGHAGFAEMGKDPVCAGASILAMTCAQCVQDAWEAGCLKKKPHVIARNGHVRVVASPKEECENAVMLIFRVAETGFTMLQEVYPQSVQATLFDPADAVSIKESSTLRTD